MNEFRSEVFGEKKPLLGTKKPRRRNGGAELSDVAVRREESRKTDTRGDDRHRLVSRQIIVVHRRKRRKMELVNLSGGGAMIAGKLKPNLGERLELEFDEGARMEAVVRWLKEGRIGLEFAHETQIDCSPEQRSALFRQIIERSFPDLAIAPLSIDAEPQAEEPEENGPESRRSEPRHPLIWSGTIRLFNRDVVVRLRNISSRGALIESDVTLSPDISLVLDLGGAGSIQAKVSWAMGDQAGLVFATEFDVVKLADSRPTAVPLEWDCPTYLRDAGKESPWEAVWGRVSMDELASSLEGYLKR